MNENMPEDSFDKFLNPLPRWLQSLILAVVLIVAALCPCIAWVVLL